MVLIGRREGATQEVADEIGMSSFLLIELVLMI